MKRKEFVTKMLAGLPALLLTSKGAPAAPVIVCIYVRIDTGSVVVKYVGCFDIPPGGSVTVTIRIYDNRTGTTVVRVAYQADGVTPIKSTSAITLTAPAGVTLP